MERIILVYMSGQWYSRNINLEDDDHVSDIAQLTSEGTPVLVVLSLEDAYDLDFDFSNVIAVE